MNPFFQALGGGQPNMMQMLNQLKSNPVDFLMKQKFNLPSNIDTKNPQSIIDHLVKSGQITQQNVNNAMQMAQKMGMR